MEDLKKYEKYYSEFLKHVGPEFEKIFEVDSFFKVKRMDSEEYSYCFRYDIKGGLFKSNNTKTPYILMNAKKYETEGTERIRKIIESLRN